MVARLNYLAQDRPDIQFAVRECAKEMSAPSTEGLERMKRIGRYLKQAPRLQILFSEESDMTQITAHTDSDWAGCKKTRRSVSAGCLRVGESVIKTWSKDQAHLALSSAEAELYGGNLGGQHALGIQNILREWGIETKITIRMDASAAIGIITRRGSGKLRHIQTNELWL